MTYQYAEFTCHRCQAPHLVQGRPGQNVPIRVLCPCGEMLEGAHTFPSFN